MSVCAARERDYQRAIDWHYRRNHGGTHTPAVRVAYTELAWRVSGEWAIRVEMERRVDEWLTRKGLRPTAE